LLQAGSPAPKLSDADLLDFIFFPVVNEGCRVVEEGVVDKPADLDVATVLAMGFPPVRYVVFVCVFGWVGGCQRAAR
jgi:enoyl-CoA hydratase/3-hydroxyacyl-CoA dehydrogenase